MKSSGILSRWADERFKKSIPIKASVELTYRCNERCTHCYLESFQDDPSRKLTLIEWKNILKKLKDAGVLYLDLMGGEAMLHSDFWDILKYSSELGFSTSMITNGLLVNEQTTKKLKKYGLQSVTISLHSLSENIHDQMTSVRGSQKKAINAIKLFKNMCIPVSVNCLLTKSNIDNFFDLRKWCDNNGIHLEADMHITPKMNGDQTPLKYRATADQIKKYHKNQLKYFGLKKFSEFENNPEDFVCGAGKLKCAVTVYGELLTCLDIRRPLGKLHKESFETLWNSDEAKFWRGLKNKDLRGKGRHTCDHCPGAALQEDGDPLLISKYSKNIENIKHEVAKDYR